MRVGSTALEFIPDYGPKYLVGTELGSIMLVTKKPKKPVEINYNTSYGLDIGRHYGPVYKIHRNPFHYRYFLSLGDWSIHLWEEDLKSPIMVSRYHNAQLTDCSWSPSRPGIFFVIRRDGWLDIWDYFHRMNQIALSYKISDNQLTSIKFNNVTSTTQMGVVHDDIGKYCAIGDSEGSLFLLKLCKSLYQPYPNEKDLM